MALGAGVTGFGLLALVDLLAAAEVFLEPGRCYTRTSNNQNPALGQPLHFPNIWDELSIILFRLMVLGPLRHGERLFTQN